MSEISPDELWSDAVRDLSRSRARELFIEPTYANDGQVPGEVLGSLFAMAVADPRALVGAAVAVLGETAGIMTARDLMAKRLAAVEGKLARAEGQLRDQQNVQFGGDRAVPWVDVPLPGMDE